MNATSRLQGWGFDLLVVALLTMLAVGVLFSPLYGSSVALLVGIPFLLFFPGYAVVAALFPEQPNDQPRVSLVRRQDNPDWLVRIALSLLLSALMVGVVGVVLNRFLTLSLVSFAGAITVVTFCGIAVASVRRQRLSKTHRADPFAGGSFDLFPGGTSRQSLTLGITIVALVLATVFVGVAPTPGEQYSEAYLLTENPGNEPTAEDYPSTFVAGEGHQLSLALSNHEHEPVTYEVVVVAQKVGPDGAVTNQQQVDRFSATLNHGETSVLERQIAPTMTGEEIRLRFLVYKGTTPGADVEPDQMLQLWIDVEAAG